MKKILSVTALILTTTGALIADEVTNILSTNLMWSAVTNTYDSGSPAGTFASNTVSLTRENEFIHFFLTTNGATLADPSVDDAIEIKTADNSWVPVIQINVGGNPDISQYIAANGKATNVSLRARDIEAYYYSVSRVYISKVDMTPRSKTGDKKANTDEPINTASGNLWFDHGGLFIPCPGIPLSFNMQYNSVQTFDGILGRAWSHSYDWRLSDTNRTLRSTTCNWKVLRTGNGEEYYFYLKADGTYESPQEENVKLSQSGGKYFVTMPGGVFCSFNTSNTLDTISNLWGQCVTLTYSNSPATGLVTRVQHSNGQTLDFSYVSNRLAQVSTITNLSMTFAYSGDGLLTNCTRWIGDVAGVTTYSWSGNLMTQKVDEVGTTFNYAYGTNGMATNLWVGGTNEYYKHIVANTWSSTSEVSKVLYARNGTTVPYSNSFYTTNHRLMYTQVPPVAGATPASTVYIYYDNGNVNITSLSEKNTNDTALSYYDQCNNLTNLWTQYNLGTWRQWFWTWNTNDQTMASETDPAGVKVGYEYTNSTLSKVRLYYNSTSSYDSVFVYTANGLLDSVTNANGHWVKYQYDQYGFPTSSTPQKGLATYSTYSPLGVLHSVKLSDGEPIIYQGGGGGGGGTPGEEYTNPMPRIITYNSDAIGKVTNIVYVTNTMQEFMFWDARGNLTNHVDSANRSTRFTYKPTGKLDSVARMVGGSNLTTSLEYDQQMNVLRVKDAKGRKVESYKLDNLYRIMAVTNLEGQTATIDWTVGDRVASATRFDGTTMRNTFDTFGNVASAIYSDATLGFTYFSNGVLRMASKSGCIVSNTFDGAMRLTNVTVTGLATVPLKTGYTLLPAGNVSSVVTVAGTNTLSYDEGERITSISQSRRGLSPLTFNVAYNGTNGMMQTLTCTNNGMSLALDYDYFDRVIGVNWGTTNVSRNFAYSYSFANMITAMSDSGLGETMGYSYDELDRLTGESHVDGTGKTNFTESIVYDEVGNRTSKVRDGVTVNYSYSNGCNRLTGWNVTQTNLYTQLDITGTSSEQIGWNSHWGKLFVSNGASVVYPNGAGSNFWLYDFQMGMGTQKVVAVIRDQAGNTTYKTNQVTLSIVTNSAYKFNTAGCVTNINYTGNGYSRKLYLTWNQQYQLSEAKTNSVSVERNGYDAFGRRVWCWDGTSTNYFVYDGADLIAEVNNTGALKRAYVYAGLDYPLAMTVYTGVTAQTYFYLCDHQGTVRGIVNEVGILVESYRLDAWGRVLGVYNGQGTPIAESTIGNRLLLHGREYSWKTGLYYSRARWADPVSGRFISKDPIRVLAGMNDYTFCGNAGINFRDPWGLCPKGDGSVLRNITWGDRFKGAAKYPNAFAFRVGQFTAAGLASPILALNALERSSPGEFATAMLVFGMGSLRSIGAAPSAAQEAYFISDGVRRSLSSTRHGLETIPATVVREGHADVQTTLRLDQLFSPKTEVLLDSRLLNIKPPIRVPIEVQPLGIGGQPASIPLNAVKIVLPGGG
ncbi:MAG: hypothetical protein C0404_09835 [Verrucomicrobia bacterium]|nr:hypothetical protein [Verrucomicrobiota bacterium]